MASHSLVADCLWHLMVACCWTIEMRTSTRPVLGLARQSLGAILVVLCHLEQHLPLLGIAGQLRCRPPPLRFAEQIPGIRDVHVLTLAAWFPYVNRLRSYPCCKGLLT